MAPTKYIYSVCSVGTLQKNILCIRIAVFTAKISFTNSKKIIQNQLGVCVL